MKKAYSKPMIYVEVMELDQPIAGGCDLPRSVYEDLVAMGYFGTIETCGQDGAIPEGGLVYGDNTVCYNSMVQTVFSS